MTPPDAFGRFRTPSSMTATPHLRHPSYLTTLYIPVATNTSRRYLRSATHGDLLVPTTRTLTYGPQRVEPPLDHRHGTVYLQRCDQLMFPSRLIEHS